VIQEVVGRADELHALGRFLDRADDRPSALVLEGEAGIGKSTLWLAAVDVACERDLRLLFSRPVEAEQGLAFTGLADLLEETLEEVAPVLAAPRRRALEAALLLGEFERIATAAPSRPPGRIGRSPMSAAPRRLQATFSSARRRALRAPRRSSSRRNSKPTSNDGLP